MKVTFPESQAKLREAVTFFQKELTALRVGRGSLQLIEGIQAEVYGQNMPLNQIANVSMVDASLVVVRPWDKNNLDAIRKAVQLANLGINPSIDNDIVRLPIPPMTEERRLEYLKILKTKEEEARIHVRQVRKDVLLSLGEDKKSGSLTEDEYKRKQAELQDQVDKMNEEIEKIAREKEAELIQV